MHQSCCLFRKKWNSVITVVLFGISLASETLGQCGPTGCFPIPSLAASNPTATYPATSNPISALPSPIVGSIRSVVRVRHETISGASLGTATLIAKREDACYFVTCAHLFDDGNGRTSLTKPRQSATRSMTAEIVAIDRQHDLALLRSTLCSLVPVRTHKFSAAEELFACGYGSTGKMRAIRGPFVGEAIPSGATMPSLRMQGSVRPGDSGGPIFDAIGRLVAIIWGERNGETYAIYGGPLERILAIVPRPRQATQTPLHDGKPRVMPLPDTEAAWLERLEGRIGSLETHVGESNRKLNELARETPQTVPIQDQPIQEEGKASSFFGKLIKAWKISDFVFGATSVGGPLGIGLLVGNIWWQRRKKKPSIQNSSVSITPIAVDSSPPPQQIVPETRYVSYEKDEFAKAHQWACEQLARKFPGSVEMLTSLDSLIRQQLAGSRED